MTEHSFQIIGGASAMKSKCVHMVPRFQTPGRISILLSERFWFVEINPWYLATVNMKARIVEVCTAVHNNILSVYKEIFS